MTKALGTLSDIAGTPPQNDPDARITELERRITNLEALVNSIVHQLDKPDKPQGRKREQQAKPRAKTKHESPAEKMYKFMSNGVHLRLEVYKACGMDEKQAAKAWGWMCQNGLVEKTGEKCEDTGSALWRATGKPFPQK